MREFFKKIIIGILTLEARASFFLHRPRVVVITGSVGKTSTKDAVYAVLSKAYRVRKSKKSFNSEIGLPLTILNLPNAWNNPFLWLLNIIIGFFKIFSLWYPSWLVLELGVDRPGDMARVAGWLKSDIAIFTHFPEVSVHVENFSDNDAILSEKERMLKTLKDDGILILNADDKRVLSLKSKCFNKCLTYGFSDTADIKASQVEISYEKENPTGIIFRVDVSGNSLPMRIEKALGAGHVYPVLSALAVADALFINSVLASSALSEYELPPGRMRIIAGKKGSTIIDDTYNSSPIALSNALAVLAEAKVFGRKIVALGDMLELGEESRREHIKAGEKLSTIAGALIAVGERALDIGNGARNSGMKNENIFEFKNSREAGEFLRGYIGEGDIILVKGSQSIRMERTILPIMAKPEKARELLVRQDAKWLKKP